MWWFYAHFLARKHRSSIKALLSKVKTNGSHRRITKGTSKRGTFTIDVGKGKRIYLDVFPPKSEEIRMVSNKENLDGRPQARQPRQMATRTKRSNTTVSPCQK